MKRLLLAVIISLFILPLQAQNNIETSDKYPTGYLKASYPYYYGSRDGVLYIFLGNDPVILVRYPAGDVRESFTVPATVSRIAQGAFKGCLNLKELILPNSLFYIADNAFDDTEISTFKVAGNDVSSSPAIPKSDNSSTRYYDTSGQPLASPTQGINIIVENGEAKKIVGK